MDELFKDFVVTKLHKDTAQIITPRRDRRDDRTYGDGTMTNVTSKRSLRSTVLPQ